MSVVTETWCTSKHDANYLLIPNYALYRQDWFKLKVGGVSFIMTLNAKYCTMIIVTIGLRYSGSSATMLCAVTIHRTRKLFINALFNGVEQYVGVFVTTNSGECQSNPKRQILTTLGLQSHEQVSMKLRIYNYVVGTTTCANPCGAVTRWVVWANTWRVTFGFLVLYTFFTLFSGSRWARTIELILTAA